jgi:thiamine biosynthesis lipoprotein
MTRLMIFLLFFSCHQIELIHVFNGHAQGTTFSIKYISTDKNTDLEKEIQLELNRLDLEISNYRPDSQINKINQALGKNPIKISPEFKFLIEKSLEVYHKSNQCFDISADKIIKRWFAFFEGAPLPTEIELLNLKETLGFSSLKQQELTLTSPKEISLDLSGIGQGYSIGQISKIIDTYQINNYLIEMGGELFSKGSKFNSPWNIGIERPKLEILKQDQLIQTLSIKAKKGMAIMTSGTYRHKKIYLGKTYSHIIDPRIAKPVEHSLLSVTVVHPDPTLADAWSTALICLGLKEGEKKALKEKINAIFIYEQDNVLHTKINFNQDELIEI